MSVIMDYIVEQGTDGIWTYEKWASGKAVCWGSASRSGIANQKWSEGHFYFAITDITFPTGLFTTTPVVNTTIEESGGNFFMSKRTSSATSLGALYAISLIEYSDTKTVVFNIEAKGRWK